MIRLVDNPQQKSEVRDLMERGEWKELAERSGRVLCLKVDHKRLKAECEAREEVGDPRWSDQSYWHWLLNRAQDVGHYSCGGDCVPEFVATCELHVGFIAIVETEDHIRRLMHDPDMPTKPSPARSRISKTQQKIVPIDKVAVDVSPRELLRNI